MNESLYPFVNHTTYDLNALRALNDIAEATVRKEKSRRTKFFGLILGVFGLVAGAMLYPKQNLIGADWYAIFFDESHGVMLDKKGFIEGDAMSFKSFIGQRTMLPIQEI